MNSEDDARVDDEHALEGARAIVEESRERQHSVRRTLGMSSTLLNSFLVCFTEPCYRRRLSRILLYTSYT